MLNEIGPIDGVCHMPFLVRDSSGDVVMLYCKSTTPQPKEPRAWKLWQNSARGQRRIETGLDDEVIECSPSAWHDAAGWHLSFVGCTGNSPSVFRLYRMDGPALDQLSCPIAIKASRAGFILRDRVVYADREDLIHVRQRTAFFDIELPGALIYRVTYYADRPNIVVITGAWIADKELFTLEYDLETGLQFLVECDGEPAYKCTMLGDQLLNAKRGLGNFEDRRIVAPESVTRKRAHVAVRYNVDRNQLPVSVASGGCGCRTGLVNDTPISRPSCLECVEKHVGAAYVLLTETRDGYAHRLRAVGHLHEAEDESQEWMALHAAIRAARKAYQVQGTMPDWQTMESLVEAVRAVPAN